jgi:nitroreductase
MDQAEQRSQPATERSAPPPAEPSAAREPAAGGIPDAPVGTPRLGSRPDDFDQGAPVGPTPAMDFWRALYGRRSIRKFRPDPVERELVRQVMHAGIWAPSSCNYQMWDLVAVDDPQVNARLAALSAQMGNAPVNIVVSYGREFSEEGSANIQSASALIQNMSLAAYVLGLGTFWITQMGDAEKVREAVGLPYDRLVIAVLALGWPKVVPKGGPKRRPLGTVSHFNHYAGRVIPSSPDPADWDPDLLAVYQRARVLNGLRHNKPRAWETRALQSMLERLVPEGREKPAAGAPRTLRWLDVLPCTGILTERLSLERPGFAFDIVERSTDVAEFVAARTVPRAGVYQWPAGPQANEPPLAAYDVVSCLYRLEDVAPEERAELVRGLARWVRPAGAVVLGFVQQRSFHDVSERLRRRRGGPRGVEYVLSPDPNIGPFEALPAAEVERLCTSAGLVRRASLGCQAVPQPDEIAFRARNFSRGGRRIAAGMGTALQLLERLPGVQSAFGRFQFRRFERPH